MFTHVSRAVDPSRKQLFLAQILEYFENNALASLSFRTLARAIGVSTYALVYHFGTRQQLLNEIVQAIAQRQKSAEEAVDAVSIDAHLAQLQASFDWQLDAANLKLQRLEFEAAMIEALAPGEHDHTRTVFAFWVDETERTLVALGLNPEDAAVESRILNNLFYGFQYDLVVNTDLDGARHAFALVMERYRDHLTTLIERSV